MPYAPGVQDISGQLRAQGIAQAGQAWGQAIGNISKDITDAFQTYKQNQYMVNQALGDFTGAVQADPSLLQFLKSGGQDPDNPNAPKTPVSPQALEVFNKYINGEHLKVPEAALLGQLGRSYIKSKSDQVQRQHIDLQNKLLGYQTQEAQRAADFWKNLQAAQQGAGVDQQAPAGGQPAPAQSPVQPAYGVGTPSPNPAVPAMLSRFLPQQPATIPQAAAAASVGGRPSGVATQQDYLAAARINPGANRALLDKEAQRIADDRLKAYLGESVYTGPEGLQKAQSKSDELNASGKAPEGMMFAPDFSESAKGFYPKLRDKPRTREEQAALAGEQTKAQELAKASVEEAKTFVSDINASAAVAIDDKARFDRIRELYSKKAESGKLNEWTLDARSALADLGLGDRAKIADEQELRGLLALGALQASKRYYKGQGSTSNEERNRIDQVVESYNKGQITNEQLIQFAEAHNRKLVKASQLDLALTKQKRPLDERGVALREWWLANPVDKFMGDGTTEVYDLNDQGIMVKTPQRPAAAATPAAAGQAAAAPQKIGRFNIIGVK